MEAATYGLTSRLSRRNAAYSSGASAACARISTPVSSGKAKLRAGIGRTDAANGRDMPHEGRASEMPARPPVWLASVPSALSPHGDPEGLAPLAEFLVAHEVDGAVGVGGVGAGGGEDGVYVIGLRVYYREEDFAVAVAAVRRPVSALNPPARLRRSGGMRDKLMPGLL